MALFTIRHEHAYDPELKRQLNDIEFLLQNVVQRTKNLAHGLTRIEAEVAGMKDEMSAEIEKLHDSNPKLVG